MSDTVSIVLWGVLFLFSLWLGGVTFLLLKTLGNYNRLTKGVSDQTLSEVLNDFLDKEKITQKELARVLEEIGSLREEAKLSIQKVGLVRFNPFADTGGDQSFALALLDGKDSGIVVTSLYSRNGVRWYVKTIRKGKGIEHELSKEEAEAVKKTLKK